MATPGFRAEIVIDIHLSTVGHNSLFCKGAVAITHFLLVQRDLDLTGVGLCILGIRLPPHFSPRASHSLGFGSRQFMFLIVSDSVFSIAIWKFNVTVSLIAFAVLSGGIALNIRRMFRIPRLYQFLMFLICTCEGLVKVSFTHVLILIVWLDRKSSRSLGHTTLSWIAASSYIRTGPS